MTPADGKGTSEPLSGAIARTGVGKIPTTRHIFFPLGGEALSIILRVPTPLSRRIMEKAPNLASLFAIGWSILLLVLAVALNG